MSNLKKEVWSKNDYYRIAGEGSSNFDHPSMKKLLELSSNAKTILDLGCGEGTRLNKLFKNGKEGYGIDISSKAIELAHKKYPKLKFIVGDMECLPFEDKTFDLVYSAFVFEHLDNPVKVLGEAIRVLKEGGKLLIVAPNFGSPNRASPPFKGNRIGKLFNGFVKDLFPKTTLEWNKVKPIADEKRYEIDWDATIEPYLGSLIGFIKKSGLKVIYYSSCWDQERRRTNLFQKKMKLLGRMNIYPFNLWGPHLLVIAEK